MEERLPTGWQPGSPRGPGRGRRALAIFAISLAVRLLLLSSLTPAALIGDEEYYWNDYAAAISAGQHLTFAQQIRPPLWGYLLVVPYRLHSDPMAGRAFTAVVGALACLAVFLLARQAYGERAGFAAGIVQALLPEHALFSNYLWSEILFGLLTVVSCIVFFRQQAPRSSGRRNALVAFSILGLALLGKEFAVVPFVGMLVLLILRKRSVWTAAACVLLFLLPAGAYSLASSVKNGKWFFLSRAMVANLGQANQLPFRAEDDVSTQLSRWIGKLETRSAPELGRNALAQVAKLWGFHSFCAWRLLGDPHQPHQSQAYLGGPYPRVARLVSIVYASVFIVGLLGLAAATGEFKSFSVASLLLLTSTGGIALLVSRFRIPFTFILSIHAGLALAEPGHVRATLKGRTREWALIGAATALMAYGGIKSFGYWG